MHALIPLLTAALTLLLASTASAALLVSVSASDTIVIPGEILTLDITIATTEPEALALGLRVANYDPSILGFHSAVVPDSIFNLSPSIPFGGLSNLASGGEELPRTGVRAGWSVNLFQGVSIVAAAGAGPESFQVSFVVGSPGQTTLDIGVFADYADVYLGGDNVVHNASVTITMVPEPGSALLVGLGLVGLAARPRAG